jgi:hypothetical protein
MSNEATPDPIGVAIEELTLGKLANALGVSGQAVRKWQAAGRLPRTEWTGETTYAARIEELTGGRVTKAELLSLRRVTAEQA